MTTTIKEVLDRHCEIQGIQLQNIDEVLDVLETNLDDIIPDIVQSIGVPVTSGESIKPDVIIESKITLKDRKDSELLSKAFSQFLDNANLAGEASVKRFNHIKYVNIIDETNDYYITFEGQSDDLIEFTRLVFVSLATFKQELHDPEFREDWLIGLESDHIPEFTNIDIVSGKKEEK